MKIVLFAIALVTSVCAGATSLQGSHAKLVAQNVAANRMNLTRLHEKQLHKFRKEGLLVPIPHDRTISIDRRLAQKYRAVRPHVRTFLVRFAARHYRAFHTPIRITSAVRTFERQAALVRTNGNAARGTDALTRSAHLTGAAVDITKIGMSGRELAWTRMRLLVNQNEHCINATEEFRQATFHVMVLDSCFGPVIPVKHTKRTAHKRSVFSFIIEMNIKM